jgi:hypothetical protein
MKATHIHLLFSIILVQTFSCSNGMSMPRRVVLLRSIAASAAAMVGTLMNPSPHEARAMGQLRDKVDQEQFLKTGMVASPMGISGQGSKSKPETGVLLRDGSVVERDPHTGNVGAEILVKGDESNSQGKQVPIFVSFRSEEWPLATGNYFDVECRDPKTGDGAFVAVTPTLAAGQSIGDVSESFIADSLFGPTGRFSMYGQPTDIKFHNNGAGIYNNGEYRTMEVSFSTLSQSTQAELPRHAQVFATIPAGTRQAVLLVGSASESRWRHQGSDALVAQAGASFRAVPAPPTLLKMRPKPRPSLDVVL